MGVHELLQLLKPFMGTILLLSLAVLSKPVLPELRPIGTYVSRYAVDDHFASPINAPSVDFIGVDGSVLIHVCLRRTMTDIVLKNDFTSFFEEMRNVLSRLQHQAAKKFCPKTTSTRRQELFIVFDGKRLNVKLENNKRDEARKKAAKSIAKALTAKYDGQPVEVKKQDVSIAVGAFAIEAMLHVQRLCNSIPVPGTPCTPNTN